MAGSPVVEIAPGVFRVADTCNVHVVRAGHVRGERAAFAVDFGSGTRSAARFTVTVRNPEPVAQCAVLRPVAPLGWCPQPGFGDVVLPAFGEKSIDMEVVVHGPVRCRTRVAVDAGIGDVQLGQHAEALVNLIEAG